MKGANANGGGGSFAYVFAICLFAVVFGCLALSAHCSSTQQQVNMRHTRGLYVSASPTNRSSYHTDIICPTDAAEDDDERKLTLIFCTVKCYCHGNHDECYCCQLKQGSSDPPVCYDKLDVCKANCPLCKPECPPATAAGFLA
ncbi:unnamed protein product [Urochloa decumbens]|uniref:Uncharacterized protein n=1 Tax=Urochloa decumbens TaxID=240449 RepID=A0ABC9ELF8_9POAL